MERSDLGGVPAFWIEGPEPAMGALSFRSGMADEPPPLRGISHLIEHLSFFTFGDRDRDEVNGFVDLLRTVFFARGTQEEMNAFLTDIARAIAEPRLDRLDVERRVLRTEAARDPGDFTARQLFLRHGYAGFGASFVRELGLGWVGPEEIGRWREDRFTSGNAAVWLHGPQPPEATLELPSGSRAPAPPADPLPRLTLPAYAASGTGGVALTVVGERRMGLTAALGIAADRLHDRLRLDRGLSYATGGTYEVLSASQAHASLGADCLDEHAVEVAETLLAVVDDLTENGPTEDELAGYAERADRADREDPDRAKDLLDRAATDALLEAEVTGADDLRAQRRALRPEDAARALAAALPSALVIAPEGTPKPRPDLADYDASETRSFEGRRFKARGLFASATLTVGAEGLTHVGGPDGTVSLPRDECVFAVRNQSGSLTVVGRDATCLEVHPRHWRHGEALLEAIEELLPRELFVPGEDEAAGEVESLAGEQLTRRWLVDEELEVLPEHLQPGERVRALGRASRGIKHGLIALTDRRLLFLYKGLRKDDLLEIPLEGVTNARGRRGLTEGKLTITHGGEKVTFSSVVPKERAREVAAALEAGAG